MTAVIKGIKALSQQYNIQFKSDIHHQ